MIRLFLLYWILSQLSATPFIWFVFGLHVGFTCLFALIKAGSE